MRMDVDNTRHQGEAAGIDDLGGVLADCVDRRNPAALNRNVGTQRVVPEPIDDRRTADHQIIHRRLPMPHRGRRAS